MDRLRAIPRRRLLASAALRCGFWASLVLIHSAALVSAVAKAWNTDDAFAAVSVNVIFLALTAAFCALKIADVRWLRMRPGWQSTLSAVVAVAILHVGVVERKLAAAPSRTDQPLGLVVLAGGALSVVPVFRTLSRVVTSLRTHQQPELLDLLHRIATWTFLKRPSVTAILLTAPRGPPF